jgi:hypothetical protein
MRIVEMRWNGREEHEGPEKELKSRFGLRRIGMNHGGRADGYNASRSDIYVAQMAGICLQDHHTTPNSLTCDVRSRRESRRRMYNISSHTRCATTPREST